MTAVEVRKGNSPVILGLPHTGTFVPDDVAALLNKNGKLLADTDWHIDRLYDGLLADATTVRTPVHRYVIDVNRDPGGQSLYPGQNTTSLCPVTDFDDRPIYREGMEPDAAEIARRCEVYHAPYHAALEEQLQRVRDAHGFAILFDCHSIRSEISFLFKGTLPDFNIGTNDGKTCDPKIEKSVVEICRKAAGCTTVLNGRFKGGWTTRHYGRPAENLHALQLELAQSTYMRESPPWTYDDARADRLRSHLKTILTTLSNWRPS
jgi:N-formylglutamate deformylase